MHLLVDAQCLQSPDSGTRGIGRYARSLLNALTAARPSWQIEAIENSRFPPLDRATFDSRLRVTSFDPLLDVRPAARAANDRFFGEWLCARRPDAILELNFFEEQMVVPMFPRGRPPVAAVVYDLIPVVFHHHYLSDARKTEWYAQRLRQFADVDTALAISEATRRDVIRLMRWPAEKVTTILGAPEMMVTTPSLDAASALRDLGIDRSFVLCVAGADARKNLRGTLAGFAAAPQSLRAAHQLVVAGALPPAQRNGWQAFAADLGIAGDVLFTGFVPDALLRELYVHCRASVFLSLYEGLGLPVLEALRAGAPIVASDRSSIPEFSEPSSTVLVDPESPAQIGQALVAVLSRPRHEGEEARRRFAAQFTWERSATLAARAVETMPRQVVGRERRLRVAWVSPLPPTRSGIADYSSELLRHLPSNQFDVEVVVSAQAATDPRLAATHRVIHEQQVDERHALAPFDLFVYHLGNSPLHVYMLDLMRRHSGLLVLHELFLGGLALRAADVGAWRDLGGALEYEDAAALASGVRAGEADHERIAREVPLNRQLLAMSEGALVHNAWSWRHLRASAPVPIFHVPMGIATPDVSTVGNARERAKFPPHAFVVATLGEVNASKRLEQVIIALSQLAPSIRARLHFLVIGGVDAAQCEHLTAKSREAGLERQVRFTGRVPLTDLTTFARAADVCVQLRYPVRGETSAALLRALAAGAACVVSDTDGFADAPPDVALRVRTPHHEIADLVTALTRLHDDRATNEAMRDRAIAFIRREHRLEDAAGRYAAAIALTVARRRAGDGDWRDSAVSALAQASVDATVDDRSILRWAELRATALA